MATVGFFAEAVAAPCSAFFPAAAFSRIFERMLFGLPSPRVEFDTIFFNVDEAAYFELDDGGGFEVVQTPIGSSDKRFPLW